MLVSSISAFVSPRSSAAYDASKAALVGLARSLAVDYGPLGIRANALCPGWVRTPMADRSMDELGTARSVSREDAYRIATEHVPLRRAAAGGGGRATRYSMASLVAQSHHGADACRSASQDMTRTERDEEQ